MLNFFCVRTQLPKNVLFKHFYCIFRSFFLILQKFMINTPIFQGKKAAYYTLGCKLNFSETSTFGRMLEEYGVKRAKKGENADICIINTCSVTETADSKSRQQIRKTIKNHPGAFVVVTGCYAQLKPETIVQIPGVDLVLGSNEKAKLIQFLSDKYTEKEEGAEQQAEYLI